MKKTFLAVSLFTAFLFLTACGGSDDKKGKEKEPPVKEKENEKESSVKVSAEMQDFMNKLDGKSESVTIAIQEYGLAGVNSNDMGMYDLKEPKILEINGKCYLLQCASGITKRKYNICWEGGRISSIEDKGME